MEKLKLEHLAPYLPYGLKCWSTTIILNSETENRIYEMGLISLRGVLKGTGIPILRPLSDLTKEIAVNGKTFVPKELLEARYYTLDLYKQCDRIIEDSRWINQCDYLLIQHLLEWHFDVFGLIEKGLAIDINTLN